MKNKVGFIFSGGYVVDELKLSFGLICPTNLPLKNKLLFDHQLEFLKKRGCNKVYLVIPENYHIKIHENQLYSNNSSSLIDTFKLKKTFTPDEKYYHNAFYFRKFWIDHSVLVSRACESCR